MNTESTDEIWKAVGGWGESGKMPCNCYGISAKNCKTGNKLRHIENSVCSKCYAMRGNFNWPHIAATHNSRQNAMEHDPEWVVNMVELFKRKQPRFFRWFDSGDLQSLQMLERILSVVKQTPWVKHWLPTREYGYVQAYKRKYGKFPKNVVIRLSAHIIDAPSPSLLAKQLGVCTSGVSKLGKHTCPAPNQNNECQTCRKCWNKSYHNIVFKYH